MDTNHITYDSYSFGRELPEELVTLLVENDDLMNGTHTCDDICSAWTLDKPVALAEILPDPPHDRVADFLTQLGTYFHYHFDGCLLYLSRFPQLPQFAHEADDGIVGVLLGYQLPDVAEWSYRHDAAITGTPDDTPRTVDRDWVQHQRDAERSFFIEEDICTPDEFDDYTPPEQHASD